MSEEWVEVRNCNWLHEAHFVKSVLESEGIEVQVPDEHTLAIQPMYAAAIGGVRVMVPATEAARAKELLESVMASPPADSPDDDV
jgi:hypothetical protein